MIPKGPHLSFGNFSGPYQDFWSRPKGTDFSSFFNIFVHRHVPPGRGALRTGHFSGHNQAFWLKPLDQKLIFSIFGSIWSSTTFLLGGGVEGGTVMPWGPHLTFLIIGKFIFAHIQDLLVQTYGFKVNLKHFLVQRHLPQGRGR